MIIKEKDLKSKTTKFERGGCKFEIEEYLFDNFAKGNQEENIENVENEIIADNKIRKFRTNDLDEYIEKNEKKIVQEVRYERARAYEMGFKISPIVERYRGIKKQEILENMEKFEAEVNERVEDIKAQWIQIGHSEGQKLAQQEVYNENARVIEGKLKLLEEMIMEAVQAKQEILKKQKKEIYLFLKSLAKWIILRELKEDGNYIYRLLERLIVELNTMDNVIVKINKDKFKEIPEVLEVVQKKLGQIRNLRIEVREEIESSGIIVEAPHSILDGGIDVQLENLDRLFEGIENL